MTAADIPGRLVHLGAAGHVPKVIVWGDSHAMAILPAGESVCKEMGIACLAATASATAPVLDWFKRYEYGLNENAPAFNAACMGYIREAASKGEITHVILAARW